MRKALLIFLVMVGAPLAARATVCTIPNVITNGNVVDATPVQQNFQALVNCVNNIDWQNIDSTGIYASQIIPINPGTATFGSNQNYQFSNQLIVLGGMVVDSTALPNSGIAGGSATQGFVLTSNAQAGSGFKLITSTALPSSNPQLTLINGTGGLTLFQIDSKGDINNSGGVAFDGTNPDGSSLIGGGTNLPFWLISKASGSAGANFAFLDSTNGIPGIILENAGATVIFSVDGAGNVQSLAHGVDNQTPPPNGITGGTGTTPFELWSNSNNATAAFQIRDKGTGNGNLFQGNNSSNVAVITVAENGQVTVGNAAATWISSSGNQFTGTVAVPTIGNNQNVCTNGSSQLVGCGTGGNQFVGTATLSVSCPSANSPCTANTPSITGLTGAFNCLASASWSTTPQLPLAGLAAQSNQLNVVFFNGTTSTSVTNTATLYYRCTNP